MTSRRSIEVSGPPNDQEERRYQKTILRYLRAPTKKHLRIVDLGCGNGRFSRALREHFKQPVISVDVARYPDWVDSPGVSFRIGSIYRLPFLAHSVDELFLKDVLHHIDEPKQRLRRHQQALREIKRVLAPGGRLTIVEANRTNPIFYLHMTLVLGHQHFFRRYFVNLVRGVFPQARFHSFDIHVWPAKLKPLGVLTEWLFNHIPCLFGLKGYTVAVIDISPKTPSAKQ